MTGLETPEWSVSIERRRVVQENLERKRGVAHQAWPDH